ADQDLHYQTFAQLQKNQTWNVILGNAKPGDNQAPVPPTDALMQESRSPRGGLDGQNPPQPLAAKGAGYLANKVNGHEWSATHGGTVENPYQDDLQSACIFPLLEPKSCAGASATASGCDCKQEDIDAGSQNPLCQNSSGAYTTTQLFGKAYPGVREL